MSKLVVLGLLGVGLLATSPFASRGNQSQRTQCVPEFTARSIAEETNLPQYPTETEPGASQAVVFAAVLFGTNGKLSKIKFYETPNAETSAAVKTALEKWKLKEIFGGGQEPTVTRTGIRFHFVFEDGKGRVEMATEHEQNEFGHEWGKRVCRSSFDE